MLSVSCHHCASHTSASACTSTPRVVGRNHHQTHQLSPRESVRRRPVPGPRSPGSLRCHHVRHHLSDERQIELWQDHLDGAWLSHSYRDGSASQGWRASQVVAADHVPPSWQPRPWNLCDRRLQSLVTRQLLRRLMRRARPRPQNPFAIPPPLPWHIPSAASHTSETRCHTRQTLRSMVTMFITVSALTGIRFDPEVSAIARTHRDADTDTDQNAPDHDADFVTETVTARTGFSWVQILHRARAVCLPRPRHPVHVMHVFMHACKHMHLMKACCWASR